MTRRQETPDIEDAMRTALAAILVAAAIMLGAVTGCAPVEMSQDTRTLVPDTAATALPTPGYVLLNSRAELHTGELQDLINESRSRGYTLHSLIPMAQDYGYIAVMEKGN